MSTATSRGGVVEPGPEPAAGELTVEIESMPDGRTIRFFAQAHVSGPRGYIPEDQTHAAEPQ